VAARLEALALLFARGGFDVSREGFVRVWINAGACRRDG
jgi:hypothetical protein